MSKKKKDKYSDIGWLYLSFHCAIIRGIKEHNDPGKYFGSTLAIGYHCEECYEAGFITKDYKDITEKGQELYDDFDLKNKPEGRFHFWTLEYKEKK